MPFEKRLVINADDFGLSPGINRAVSKAHSEGILTSATLFANFPSFNEAIALARKAPGLGVGVHLNVIEGKPLLSGEELPDILAEDGTFLGSLSRLLRRYLLAPKRVLRQVALEWGAQIDRFLSSGLHPTHIDSHKHIHAFPPFFRLAVGLASRRGIRAIRLPRESSSWLVSFRGAPRPGLFRCISSSALNVFFKWNLSLATSGGLKTTGSCYGIAATGKMTVERFESILWDFPGPTGEIVMHPGYRDDELPVPTRLRESRESELEILLDTGLKTLVEKLGIRLIHFGNL